MRSSALLISVFLMVGWTSTLQAQEVELSDSQKQLNEQGVQAILDGEPDKAIRVFKTALTLGDANVLYLNYGRALAAAGRCEEAIEAYKQVELAPKVALPSAEEVAKVLDVYRQELSKSCPGKVSLRCQPSQVQVSIDGAEPIPCPKDGLSLPPGTHVIAGILGTEQIAESVELKAGETVELALVFEGAEEAQGSLQLRCAPDGVLLSIDGAAPVPCSQQPLSLAPGQHELIASMGDWSEKKSIEVVAEKTVELSFSAPVATELPKQVIDDDGASWVGITGWALLGTGVALLGTSLVLDLAVLEGQLSDLENPANFANESAFNDAKSDAESLQSTNTILLIGGGVVTAAGAAFLIASLLSDDEEPAKLSLLPVVSPSGLGLRIDF